MKQVLWINSCMRGAGQSRTLELCRTFLEELRVRRPGLKVAERDLTRAELPVMTAELSRRREELAAEGRVTRCSSPPGRWPGRIWWWWEPPIGIWDSRRR